MTEKTRWLDELPAGAPERELLLAARAARPPAGAADADWQALCAALGATAVTSSAATGVAVHSAAVKTASATAASKAAGVAWGVAVKWFVVGAALGCGVAGAGAVAERVRRPSVLQAGARPLQRAEPAAARPRARTEAPPSNLAEPPAPAVVSPAAVSATPSSAPVRTEGTSRVDVTPSPQDRLPSAAEFPAAPAGPAALAQQARELAEVKRLIDSGAAASALGRLEAARLDPAFVGLSEERDALYVQALLRARRLSEARRAAQAFLARYPRSPYAEAMQRASAEE